MNVKLLASQLVTVIGAAATSLGFIDASSAATLENSIVSIVGAVVTIVGVVSGLIAHNHAVAAASAATPIVATKE